MSAQFGQAGPTTRKAPLTMNRRQYLKGATAICATGLAGWPASAGPLDLRLDASPPPAIGPADLAAQFRPVDSNVIIDIAKRELQRLGAAIAYADRVAVVDYARHSTLPRFHLLNFEAGTSASFLVTHGRGSDPDHLGWVQSFSNIPDSLASSRGAYRCNEQYNGTYGAAMRLEGLDPSNDLAMDRAIVLHSAWYAESDMIAKQGKLGRSEGCLVFSSVVLPVVLDRLGPGRLLFVDNL